MTVNPQVIEAARSGDSDAVVKLCREANPFVASSSLAESALLTACEYGQLSVVRSCLLDLKCNPNCVDKSGRSPLHMAVLRKENGKVSVSILKFLTENGAQLRKSVLHVCCNDLAISPLIELGADVNAKSVDGLTPIAVAVSNDRFGVVHELIRAGSNVSADLVFSVKSACVAKELVRAGLDINHRDNTGLTALQRAVEKNDKRLARSLLEAKADPTLVSRTPSVEDDRPTASSSSCSIGPWTDGTMNGLLVTVEEVARVLSTNAQYANLEDMVSIDVDEWAKAESLLREAASAVNVIKSKIDKFNKSLSANSFCVICKSKPKSIVMMPCKHLCCCSGCSQALLAGGSWERKEPSFPTNKPACPVCRNIIEDVVKVFT